MQIKDSKILVLGGWGLVGMAICRKLMEFEPRCMVITSLNQWEAEDACEQLRYEYTAYDPHMFVPKWGNIFARTEWKDQNWSDVLAGGDTRREFIKDVFYDLDDKILKSSALYELIVETKPDLVIDCINTATAIAYLDIYNTTIKAIKRIDEGNLDKELIEQVMASAYVPQLIRHIQILYRGLLDAKTTMYFKVGTSGTGGMGVNIPYTHSEERPSRVLLSKTAVAGAQTLLLYLLARTPDGPLVKEIKPAAAIAWKRIAYGEVKRRGRSIPLVTMELENAHQAEGKFIFDDKTGVFDTGDVYKSVFIDTGENGIFSKGEFEAISALGQMEMVTPEEIADYLVHEVRGGNTGRDVIQGLDAFALGPTYRGGMLRNIALDKIKKLEKENDVDSVAFELLGPPRLSKLLYEGYLLKRIVGSMKNLKNFEPEVLSEKAMEIIKTDKKLVSEMLSIGLAILLSDGKKYLRGADVKIPVRRGDKELDMTKENLEQWCFEGWIDLRPSSFKDWQDRVEKIIAHANQVPEDETGSRYCYTLDYWNNFDTFEEGKIAGWLFEFEDKGWRFKR